MRNKKINIVKALVLLLALLSVSIYSASAYDFIIKINETELPSSSEFSIVVEGVNETINIDYGGFLSGLESIDFINRTNKTITVDALVPFDVEKYEYISYVNLTNNDSYSVQFQIIDDVYFDLMTDDLCFLGSVQEIIPEAPLNSTISIKINGDIISYSGEYIISYTPQNTGTYEIIADFSYRDNIEQFKKNFTVYEMISCSINGNDIITENESILFSSGLNGGIGDISYSWDFDDGTESEVVTPTHLFSEPGEYNIELTVTDEQDYRKSCNKIITVNEHLYDIVLILIDNKTGKYIGDANVTFNDSLKKSNIDGKAKFFNIPKGDYELLIIKPGYDNYSQMISVSADKTFNINLSEVPEDRKPVPHIELLYPLDGHVTENPTINFDFRVSSETPIDYCYLLYNEKANLGYRIKGDLAGPASGSDYSFNLDLNNGEFKWNVQCENKDGIGMADDRGLFVRGLETFQDNQDTGPAIDKQDETKKEDDSEFDVDISGFTRTINEISEFNKEIISSSASIRDVFDILNYQSTLDKSSNEVKKLKQEMIDLQGLSISTIDKERKKNEILENLKKIRIDIPKRIIIIDELMYDIDTENNNVKTAIDEYLEWKGYELSKSEYKKYSKKVSGIQKELGVHAVIRNVQIEYLNDEKKDFGIVSKEVYQQPESGAIYLEIIPKTVAETVNHLEFSVNIEVVNKDPIVRIYTQENDKFSYYIRQKIDFESLKTTDSVLVLDLNHPQNKITGFSILDTSSGPGKFFFILILIGVVVSANYFIFFREKVDRDKFVQNYKNVKDNFKFKSPEEKLMILLDKIIDQLNIGETQTALGKYSVVLEIYQSVDTKLQNELKPIIEHLFFELEVYNLNIMIDDAYSKTMNGKWYEAVDTYNEIHDNISYIPSNFKNKIDRRLKKLDLSMDIHIMKSHRTSLNKEKSIDDSLYGASK